MADYEPPKRMDHSHPDHVYYHRGDCAGIWTRLAVALLDLAVLLVLLFLCTSFAFIVGMAHEDERPPAAFLVFYCGLAFLYLTAMKRSKFRTPAYRIFGLRIVDLMGQPPSMFIMTLRLLWWLLGPISPILDLMLVSDDDQRQTVRDKLFGTLVIRAAAKPAGHGVRTHGRLGFLGMMLTFPTVTRPDT